KPSVVYKKVPPAFDTIVLKLTARNQEDRYPSAAAVLADLAAAGFTATFRDTRLPRGQRLLVAHPAH
ncbi:MAG TPA: hypothetical protein VLA78_10210, partial [Paracoccaceae bacterium]|nr:hypothetical protein [Paracoccaceae bacterium]